MKVYKLNNILFGEMTTTYIISDKIESAIVIADNIYKSITGEWNRYLHISGVYEEMESICADYEYLKILSKNNDKPIIVNGDNVYDFEKYIIGNHNIEIARLR